MRQHGWGWASIPLKQQGGKQESESGRLEYRNGRDENSTIIIKKCTIRRVESVAQRERPNAGKP